MTSQPRRVSPKASGLGSPLAAWTAVSVAVLFVVGCTAGTEPAPEPIGTATATQTPTISPAAVQPFGGDCANVLDAATVESALGGAVLAASTADEDLDAVGTAGGISCRWVGGATVLRVTAFPTDTVPSDLVALASEPTCDPALSPVGCGYAAAADGTWVLALLQGEPQPTLDAASPALTSAVSAALAAAAGFDPPVAATPTNGWWSLAGGCEAVGDALDVTAVLGTDPISPMASDLGSAIWYRVPEALGALLQCEWGASDPNSPATGLRVVIEPGSHPQTLVPPAITGAALTAAPVEIAGATSAISWTDPVNWTADELAGVTATDGVNVLRITRYGTGPGAPGTDPVGLAGSLLAALAAG